MELEKMKQHVIMTARNYKKALGANVHTKSLRMDVFTRTGGGKSERYVFEFGGKEFESDNTSISSVKQVSRMFSEAATSLNAIQGYRVKEIRDKFWYEGRDVFGRTMMSEDITIGLILYVKPCKEYEALRRMIERYTKIELLDLDLYAVSVLGKRGTNYTETGSRQYYDFCPKKCLTVMDWIRKHKSSSDTLSVGIFEEIQCDDKEYSVFYETESYGTKHRYLSLRVITKGGKEKAICNTMYM